MTARCESHSSWGCVARFTAQRRGACGAPSSSHLMHGIELQMQTCCFLRGSSAQFIAAHRLGGRVVVWQGGGVAVAVSARSRRGCAASIVMRVTLGCACLLFKACWDVLPRSGCLGLSRDGLPTRAQGVHRAHTAVPHKLDMSICLAVCGLRPEQQRRGQTRLRVARHGHGGARRPAAAISSMGRYRWAWDEAGCRSDPSGCWVAGAGGAGGWSRRVQVRGACRWHQFDEGTAPSPTSGRSFTTTDFNDGSSSSSSKRYGLVRAQQSPPSVSTIPNTKRRPPTHARVRVCVHVAGIVVT